MRSNRQFLWIGSFVLIGFALIVAILLWFSESNRKSYNTYRVIFHEAIDGVTSNSVVKYNGVEIGKVHAVDLDEKDPNNIFVDIDVVTSLPITTNTYATIKPQGVTGMSYVSLSVNPSESYTVIKPHNSMPYPVLKTRNSFLTNLVDQAQKIGNNVNDVTGQVKVLLNDQNIEHVSHIITNLDTVTTAVANQSANISKSISTMGEILDNFNQNAQNLNNAIIQLNSLSKSLESNSQHFDGVLDTIQNNTLTNINTVLLPNLNQSMNNINNITTQFNELLRTVNQNPAVFVRGKSAPKAAPGE